MPQASSQRKWRSRILSQTQCLALHVFTRDEFGVMQNATNPPSITLPYGTKFPNLTAVPSLTTNSCNSYLPSDTTLNRFIYIVNLITANGLYVVSHPDPLNPDYYQSSTLWELFLPHAHFAMYFRVKVVIKRDWPDDTDAYFYKTNKRIWGGWGLPNYSSTTTLAEAKFCKRFEYAWQDVSIDLIVCAEAR